MRAQNSTCRKTSIKRAQLRLFHTRHKRLPTDIGSKASTGFESLGKEKTMINFVLYVGYKDLSVTTKRKGINYVTSELVEFIPPPKEKKESND